MMNFICKNCLDLLDRKEGQWRLCEVNLERSDVFGAGNIFRPSYILHEVKAEHMLLSVAIFLTFQMHCIC